MNKTIIFRYLLSVSCFAIFLSCGKTKQTTDNDVQFDTLHSATVYHLDSDTTKPSCSLNVEYIIPIKYKNDSVLSEIKRSLNVCLFGDESNEILSADSALAQFVKNCEEIYVEDAKLFFSEKEWDASLAGTEFYSMSKDLTTHVLFNGNNILSYQIIQTDFKGNQNSSTLYRNVVFDLNDGHMISEQEIFTPDYRSVLSKLIISKILEQNQAQSIDQLFPRGFWIDDLATNNNFYVNDKGVTYIFNENEYSERANGCIEVFIPYLELNNILSSTSPIASLYTE